MTDVREAVREAQYPLPLPDAPAATASATQLARQLDDYLLPRLRHPDAPLLAIASGPTGAGKSTLINSLVRAPVSAAGVLRPTTRAPVLASNPGDTAWFSAPDLLPELPRATGLRHEPGHLQLVATPELAPGLALLDTPDIDSVLRTNRQLARQVIATADLWLFVTTAARYADALPWEVLSEAHDRGTMLAVVLNRVPPGAEDALATHVAELLHDHDLDRAHLFVLPEVSPDEYGLLPERLIGPLRGWLAHLTRDTADRDAVLWQTLHGALAAIPPTVRRLAEAADSQVASLDALAEATRRAYQAARETVARESASGTLLAGETLGPWRQFVAGGELARDSRTWHEVHTNGGRPRATDEASGPAGKALATALSNGLVTMIHAAAREAEDTTVRAWRQVPGGRALLARVPRTPEQLPARIDRAVRDWLRNSTLLIALAVLASDEFTPTGAQLALAGGGPAASRRALAAAFGDREFRERAADSRADLLARVDALLVDEAARFTRLLDGIGVRHDLPARLRAAADLVDQAQTPQAHRDQP